MLEGCAAATPTPPGRTRPGIKVQDGCDNRCTYCIVWKARGKARSVAADEVLLAVRQAQGRGAREVVLTASTGLLPLRRSGRPRARAAGPSRPSARAHRRGAHPPLLDRAARRHARALRHDAAAGERVGALPPHLPAVRLRRDPAPHGRASTAPTSSAAWSRPRASTWPGVALGTDLIVGFPGETDAEFERSLAFCREMRFAKMHVFRYSRRPRDPAATMPGQVDPHVMAVGAAHGPVRLPTSCASRRRAAWWARRTSWWCSTRPRRHRRPLRRDARPVCSGGLARPGAPRRRLWRRHPLREIL